MRFDKILGHYLRRKLALLRGIIEIESIHEKETSAVGGFSKSPIIMVAKLAVTAQEKKTFVNVEWLLPQFQTIPERLNGF